ncbi:MBL fold metallo-hydrolase [Bacillus salitolerans]|uniref:MBL fold metallo-hydrolase n=1 Tax=Bacillus salitolerans TaxID=1437434 RepID=A0ABW4LYP6_9BACI
MNGSFTSKHFTLEKVSEHVYSAIAKEDGGSGANAGFVNLGDKTIVFDTFNTQQAAEDLKILAENITGQPVKWVINSHWHGDHIRGNQVFKDSQIISSNLTYSKMKDTHPTRIKKQKDDIEGLTNYIQTLKEQLTQNGEMELHNQIGFLMELKLSLPTLELVLPSQTFHDEISFYGSERSAKLFTLGGGHSFCDSMLYIPDEKVMFMGDLLFVHCHPTFFEETNPLKWMEILKKIHTLEIDAAIPGHGLVGTKEDITLLTRYINELCLITSEGLTNKNIKVPDRYKHWSSPENYIQNVTRIVEWKKITME